MKEKMKKIGKAVVNIHKDLHAKVPASTKKAIQKAAKGCKK
jgi:hypothetical protein